MRRVMTRFELWTVAAFAALLILILPCLNAFTSADSFFHVSNFTINLYGKYLCYGISPSALICSGDTRAC